MPKTKNKRARSTADLVIGHAKKHLKKNPHLELWTRFSNFKSPLIFAFAGIVVMLAAFFVLNSADPAFTDSAATDYESQKAFYSNEEEVHASSSELAIAQMKIHEAARAVELSRTLNFVGLFLILGALWYFHKEHGIFNSNRAGFIIRRIE